MTSDGETKRRILGEEIVKEIRFPLISQKDFASVVFDSRILNLEEFGNMLKYYSGVLTTPLPFLQASRIDSTMHRCCRFQTFCSPKERWNYGGAADCIILTVKKPVKLYGAQHFGSESGEYTVTTDVIDPLDNTSLVSRTGSYTSEKSDTHAYYGFDVLFDRPVILKADKEHKVKSLIEALNRGTAKAGKHQWSARECSLHFVARGIALMGPMKTEDSFLEFCFQHPSRNSNVTRTVPLALFTPFGELCWRITLSAPRQHKHFRLSSFYARMWKNPSFARGNTVTLMS